MGRSAEVDQGKMSIPVVVLTSLVLALLAVVSAFFSGMETALFSINGFQVRRWREREPVVAAQFEKLMLNSRGVLSVILLTDTLVNVPLIIIALDFVNAIPMPVPNWVKTLVIFGLIVFVCDLLPKLLALADPFRFSKSALQILAVLDAGRRTIFAISAGARRKNCGPFRKRATTPTGSPG